MRFRHLFPFALIAALAASQLPSAEAATRRNVDIPERVRGAERAVVGQVVGVHPRLVRNTFGDELIVTRVSLRVEETLKGAPAEAMDVEVEGGTVGELTLDVSDMPTMSVGQRGVFFLQRAPGGATVPHLRGLGILKLDSRDFVERSSLSLDMIRTMARQVAAQ